MRSKFQRGRERLIARENSARRCRNREFGAFRIFRQRRLFGDLRAHARACFIYARFIAFSIVYTRSRFSLGDRQPGSPLCPFCFTFRTLRRDKIARDRADIEENRRRIDEDEIPAKFRQLRNPRTRL